MSEDTLVDPAEAPDTRYGETLLFDFAKFLTTLSLVALGGVLSLSAGAGHGTVRFNLASTAIAIALAGALALVTADGIVRARVAGLTPRRWLRYPVQAAMVLLGFGAGGFVVMYLDSLK